MPVSYEFHSLPMTDVIVSEDRQRKNLEKVDELAASINRNGLLHPIVVTRDGTLVSGGRRYEAFKLLNATTIPVHYLDELAPHECKAIELEENIKRVNLTWKESCIAAAEYHDLRTKLEPNWTRQATAEAIGLSPQHMGKLIQVAREINSENERVLAASNFDAAYNVIRRAQDRAVKTQVAQLDIVNQEVGAVKVSDLDLKPEPKVTCQLIVGDFVEWADNYTGRKFNFVHCDFPYGVNYSNTGYSGSQTWKKYADDPEVYRILLAALVKNKDKIFFPSAHLMFWFSMNYYDETVRALTKAGFAVNPFPLIWMKDRGIIPDSERGPRRVYETALMASLGDRKVIKSPNNAFYLAVKKEGHISTKPQAMLKEFLCMFVEDTTEMLDPTCGGGSALAVARRLGAKRLVGLDVDEEHIETAQLAMDLVK